MGCCSLPCSSAARRWSAGDLGQGGAEASRLLATVLRGGRRGATVGGRRGEAASTPPAFGGEWGKGRCGGQEQRLRRRGDGRGSSSWGGDRLKMATRTRNLPLGQISFAAVPGPCGFVPLCPPPPQSPTPSLQPMCHRTRAAADGPQLAPARCWGTTRTPPACSVAYGTESMCDGIGDLAMEIGTER